MFYTKTINIYIDSKPLVDMLGIVRRGEMELVDTLKVDVQPINKLQIQKEYGINADATYRIFAPLNPHLLSTGSYVEYNGNMYKIMNIMEWDDFIELLVGNLND